MGEAFQLSEVVEVVELHTGRDLDKKVNEYLALGWVLLGTHVRDACDPAGRLEKRIYSLGWPKSRGTPERPEAETYDDIPRH